MSRTRTRTGAPRWLLLLHQIPRKPVYLRVKIWRRLQKLGAVAIKNSVYALPRSEERNEDLQWVMREVTAGGGEATLCEANFLQGVSDADVEAHFNAARDADYATVADGVRKLARRVPARRFADEKRRELTADLHKLRQRFDEIVAIDFFSSSGREATLGLLDALAARLRPAAEETLAAATKPEVYRARTWVTRKGIFVDRIASAWLIRRFIDGKARFKYVVGKGYKPEPGELRFDMFDAEFTHVGDKCTFEVLCDRCGLDDRSLRAIGEIVHDIDIKDGKFARAEAGGIESLLAAIAVRSGSDEERLERGSVIFDDLYGLFQRKR